MSQPTSMSASTSGDGERSAAKVVIVQKPGGTTQRVITVAPNSFQSIMTASATTPKKIIASKPPPASAEAKSILASAHTGQIVTIGNQQFHIVGTSGGTLQLVPISTSSSAATHTTSGTVVTGTGTPVTVVRTISATTGSSSSGTLVTHSPVSQQQQSLIVKSVNAPGVGSPQHQYIVRGSTPNSPVKLITAHATPDGHQRVSIVTPQAPRLGRPPSSPLKIAPKVTYVLRMPNATSAVQSPTPVSAQQPTRQVVSSSASVVSFSGNNTTCTPISAGQQQQDNKTSYVRILQPNTTVTSAGGGTSVLHVNAKQPGSITTPTIKKVILPTVKQATSQPLISGPNLAQSPGTQVISIGSGPSQQPTYYLVQNEVGDNTVQQLASSRTLRTMGIEPMASTSTPKSPTKRVIIPAPSIATPAGDSTPASPVSVAKTTTPTPLTPGSTEGDKIIVAQQQQSAGSLLAQKIAKKAFKTTNAAQQESLKFIASELAGGGDSSGGGEGSPAGGTVATLGGNNANASASIKRIMRFDTANEYDQFIFHLLNATLRQGGAQDEEGGDGRARKPCNCTKSKCLKLYCDCFASGEFCLNCNCVNCSNNLEHEAKRKRAIQSCLDRNPFAFHPKIGTVQGKIHGDMDPERRHTKGCNCKRSGCLKNYCECYEARIPCSNRCRCVSCKNVEGNQERQNSMQMQAMGDTKHLAMCTLKSKISAQLALSADVMGRAPESYCPASMMTSEVIEATTHCMLTRMRQERDHFETTRRQMDSGGRRGGAASKGGSRSAASVGGGDSADAPPTTPTVLDEEEAIERSILEEFGQCLGTFIESALKLRSVEMAKQNSGKRKRKARN